MISLSDHDQQCRLVMYWCFFPDLHIFLQVKPLHSFTILFTNHSLTRLVHENIIPFHVLFMSRRRIHTDGRSQVGSWISHCWPANHLASWRTIPDFNMNPGIPQDSGIVPQAPAFWRCPWLYSVQLFSSVIVWQSVARRQAACGRNFLAN